MTSIEIKTGVSAKSMIFAVALTALAMGKAYGATLNTAGVIAGNSITVGDVFDGAGPDAARWLAPAPAAGGSVMLDAHDLARISDAFNLGWKPETQKETLVLHRAPAGTVDRYAIEAAIQESMAAQLDGQPFDLELSDKAVSLNLPAGADRTVEALSLRIDLRKNTFTALVSAPAGAEHPLARKEVSGRLYTLTKVPVLKASAGKGDIIGAADLDYIDMRTSDVSVSTVADASDLIGRTPRRTIVAMRPVSAADIEPPVLVKKGDLVTVALQAGGLGLTMQARALQNGAEGEVVRVVNTASNRMIEGVVTGSRTIAMRLPSGTM